MSSQPEKAGRKRKRVVPDELRRRTAVSCDRCKLRRAKCIRAGVEEPCSNCLSSHVKCEYTLPRKHRVYGSLESLSLRYRALDALVKGLLPNEDTNDVDNLYRIALKKGIHMPSIEDQSTNEEILQNHHQSPPSTAQQTILQKPTQTAAQGPNPFFESSTRKAREEKLIPAPHGVGHYVGPSSSLGFAVVVRKMVAQCCANPKFLLAQRQQKSLSADFITLKTSKALEPRDVKYDDNENEVPPNDDVYDHQPGKTATASDGVRSSQTEFSRRSSTVSEFLPPRSTADALIHSFFETVHPNFQLFHRTIFQLRYEALWDRRQQSLNELEPGWICCVCVIFVFGAQTLEQHDKKQSMLVQKRYIGIARSYFDQLVATTSLENVQALLLLQLYYHNIGERNASWMFLGSASRMAAALGMHREGANAGFDLIERNIRKTVWWSLYVFERNLCIILGRPSAIEETEISITLPDQANFDSNVILPSLTSVTVALTKIAHSVKQEIYGPFDSRSGGSDTPNVSVAKGFLLDLQSWHNNIPAHLRPGWNAVHAQQSRAIRLLDMQYHHTKSLVTRPFLLARVNADISKIETGDSTDDDPCLAEIISLGTTCIYAAESVISQAANLVGDKMLDGVSWLDTYYVYHAVFILSLDLVARQADHVDSLTDLSRKASIKSILNSVRAAPLAPTFRTLVHVASQFASLVGALGRMEGSDEESETRDIPAARPSATQSYRSQVETTRQTLPQNAVSDRVQSSQPWDFMNMPTFGQPYSSEFYDQQAGVLDELMFPSSVGGTFGIDLFGNGNIATPFGSTDDWAARALRDMGRGFS